MVGSSKVGDSIIHFEAFETIVENSPPERVSVGERSAGPAGWHRTNHPRLSPLGRGRNLAPARLRVRGPVAPIRPLTRFARCARKPPSPQRGEGLKGDWDEVITVMTVCQRSLQRHADQLLFVAEVNLAID